MTAFSSARQRSPQWLVCVVIVALNTRIGPMASWLMWPMKLSRNENINNMKGGGMASKAKAAAKMAKHGIMAGAAGSYGSAMAQRNRHAISLGVMWQCAMVINGISWR